MVNRSVLPVRAQLSGVTCCCVSGCEVRWSEREGDARAAAKAARMGAARNRLACDGKGKRGGEKGRGKGMGKGMGKGRGKGKGKGERGKGKGERGKGKGERERGRGKGKGEGEGKRREGKRRKLRQYLQLVAIEYEPLVARIYIKV